MYLHIITIRNDGEDAAAEVNRANDVHVYAA